MTLVQGSYRANAASLPSTARPTNIQPLFPYDSLNNLNAEQLIIAITNLTIKYGYSFRTLALNKHNAPSPLLRTCAVHGRLAPIHQFWIRRTARPHGEIHCQIRQLHRSRAQARPGRAQSIPHERGGATWYLSPLSSQDEDGPDMQKRTSA